MSWNGQNAERSQRFRAESSFCEPCNIQKWLAITQSLYNEFGTWDIRFAHNTFERRNDKMPNVLIFLPTQHDPYNFLLRIYSLTLNLIFSVLTAQDTFPIDERENDAPVTSQRSPELIQRELWNRWKLIVVRLQLLAITRDRILAILSANLTSTSRTTRIPTEERTRQTRRQLHSNIRTAMTRELKRTYLSRSALIGQSHLMLSIFLR